jgi:hypothetical protein
MDCMLFVADSIIRGLSVVFTILGLTPLVYKWLIKGTTFGGLLPWIIVARHPEFSDAKNGIDMSSVVIKFTAIAVSATLSMSFKFRASSVFSAPPMFSVSKFVGHHPI